MRDFFKGFFQFLAEIFTFNKNEQTKIETDSNGPSQPTTTPNETPVEVDQNNQDQTIEPNRPIFGIDFYHGEIVNWSKVNKDEIDFIFIKATESETFIDKKVIERRKFIVNELKVPCGFYHFYRTHRDPIKQAKIFCNVIGKLNKGELPPVLDWETDDDKGDGADINEVQKFLDYVESRLGVTPIIYGGSSFLESRKLPESFKRYPLWLAHYTTKEKVRVPRPWNNYTIWQFTDKANIKGFDGEIDGNYFNGSLVDLKKLVIK